MQSILDQSCLYIDYESLQVRVNYRSFFFFNLEKVLRGQPLGRLRIAMQISWKNNNNEAILYEYVVASRSDV